MSKKTAAPKAPKPKKSAPVNQKSAPQADGPMQPPYLPMEVNDIDIAFPTKVTASKYQAEWKTFDKNKAFWEEVLVGRVIVSAAYDGTNPAQATSADGTGLVARYSIMLDTKEVVYLPGDPDWGDLDLIAPAPAGPVMQRIQRLAWDDIGIAEIVLQAGTIKLDKTWKGRGRLWIQDGWDRAGTTSGPTPGVDPIAEEVDKQILNDIKFYIEKCDLEGRRTRFAITHVSDRDGLRTLSLGNHGPLNHFDTQEEAEAWLIATDCPGGLSKVLTRAEVETLAVSPIECYAHGEAVGVFHDRVAVTLLELRTRSTP